MNPRTYRAWWAVAMASVCCTRGIYHNTALADGFHGAAVVTNSLDDYLAKLKQVAPDIVEKMKKSEMRALSPDELKAKIGDKKGTVPGAAGRIDARLSAKDIAGRKQIAANCTETLLYLDKGNVLPHEFPNFPMHQISEYRKTAKKILTVLGREGNQAILDAVTDLLMKGADDMHVHAQAPEDLVELLRLSLRSEPADPQDIVDLLTVASGHKRGSAMVKLASEVSKVVIETADRRTLERVVELLDDPQTKKIVQKAIVAAKAKDRVNLNNALDSGSMSDLLRMVEAADDEQTRGQIVERLGRHELTRQEARVHLPDIWNLLRAEGAVSGSPAFSQLAAAVDRASPDDMLLWLATADPQLTAYLWKQSGPHLVKDEKKKRALRDMAIIAVASAGSSLNAKRAGLDALARLKDPQAAVLLLDAIPENEQLKRIPIAEWPRVATVLRELTGEKYGPREGQRALEAAGQIKQWRRWRAAQSGE